MVYWFSMDELPDEPVEGAKLVLDLEEPSGVVDSCQYFCFVADDVWVFEDVFCLHCRVFCDDFGVEVGEGFSEGFSPLEDQLPG